MPSICSTSSHPSHNIPLANWTFQASLISVELWKFVSQSLGPRRLSHYGGVAWRGRYFGPNARALCLMSYKYLKTVEAFAWWCGKHWPVVYTISGCHEVCNKVFDKRLRLSAGASLAINCPTWWDCKLDPRVVHWEMGFIPVTAITLRLINVLNASRKSFISNRKRKWTQFRLNFVSSQSDFLADKKAAMTSQTIHKKRKTPSEKSTLRKRNKKPGGKNVFQLNWFWIRSVWLLSVFGPLKSAYLPTTKNAQPTPNTLKIKFRSWSKEMDSLNGSIVTTLRMYLRNYLLLNKERAASLKSIFVYRLFAWNSFPFSLCPPPVCFCHAHHPLGMESTPDHAHCLIHLPSINALIDFCVDICAGLSLLWGIPQLVPIPPSSRVSHHNKRIM